MGPFMIRHAGDGRGCDTGPYGVAEALRETGLGGAERSASEGGDLTHAKVT